MSQLVSRELEAQGFAVDVAASLEEARSALRLAGYALVVLDRRLGDGDGLSLLRAIRERQGAAAVLVLSAMGDVADRVAGLNTGADDYLGKPFDMDELRARIRAAVRRAGSPPGGAPIRCGRLVYDPAHREFLVGDQPLVFRRRELALLEALVRRARRVVQRDTLINEVYGFNEEPSSNTLDAHVSRLRRRLEAMDCGVTIDPVRGVGYLLDDR